MRINRRQFLAPVNLVKPASMVAEINSQLFLPFHVVDGDLSVIRSGLKMLGSDYDIADVARMYVKDNPKSECGYEKQIILDLRANTFLRYHYIDEGYGFTPHNCAF